MNRLVRAGRVTRRDVLAMVALFAASSCAPTAVRPTGSVVPTPGSPSPSPDRIAAIDAYFADEMAKRRIPGVALVVSQRGKVINEAGYGFANLELDVRTTPDSVFELASVTKQFTAAAVMRLVEEGKVDLDKRFADYVIYAPDKWDGIRIRHLLTHTAGLPALEDGFRSLWTDGPRQNHSTSEMFQAATEDELRFTPGEVWQYSDVGYFLLGMVIEKASGQPYASYLQQQFFGPLAMNATSVLDQRAIVKNRAAGYTLRGNELIHIRRVIQSGLASHYGVLSSVRDLAKWEAALVGQTVLRPSSLEQMWTRVRLNDGSSRDYGFGWEIKDLSGHRVITHRGITGTEYTRFPDDGLTVIVLTNLGWGFTGTPVDPWGLTFGVARLLIPDLTS